MCSTLLQPLAGKHSEASLFNRAANYAVESDTCISALCLRSTLFQPKSKGDSPNGNETD